MIESPTLGKYKTHKIRQTSESPPVEWVMNVEYENYEENYICFNLTEAELNYFNHPDNLAAELPKTKNQTSKWKLMSVYYNPPKTDLMEVS